jgi:hypothetical protein
MKPDSDSLTAHGVHAISFLAHHSSPRSMHDVEDVAFPLPVHTIDFPLFP